MIDQYKYTWKMVKPLIPIIFLAIWVVLFEDKIWPDWENEIPIKNFGRGEIQRDYEMNSDHATPQEHGMNPDCNSRVVFGN